MLPHQYRMTVNSTILLLFLILGLKSFSQQESSYEEYKKKVNQNYNEYTDNLQKSYDKYVEEEQKKYLVFKKSIEQVWGKNEFKISTQKDWVEYSNDKRERSVVDFENGVVSVEVLMEPEKAGDLKATKKKLEDAVIALTASEGKTKDFSTEFEEAKVLSEQPVLKEQIRNDKGVIVNHENSKEFAKTIIENTAIDTKLVQGEDGIEKVKVKLSFNLAPDHIKVRANKYLNEVQTYSLKYDLPLELVYAVIHTESYFNPKAKSHVPAFGLMQLVPRSGGRDAYQYVYHKDKVLTENYLYQPDKNIELGAAYLRLLINRHFKGVKDLDSRLLCATASYNTGAGNFSRAFTGRTNPNEIIPIINKMTYDELYDFLKSNLPYDETKGYIEKISKRINLYTN